jgi:DUF1009 family protein
VTRAAGARQDTLGIVAGGGALPLSVARAALAAGRPVFAAVIDGWADPAPWRDIPHLFVRIGATGRILKAFEAHGVRQLVLAGAAKRPSVLHIAQGVDATGLRLLAKLGRAMLLGDDGFLRGVDRVLATEGFEIIAPQAILAALLPPAGLLTPSTPPDALARADIARGVAVCRALGGVDVGQAVVVQQGLVLGVEAIEGTDALLARCGALRREGPGGVLVKLAKPGQDRRLDLPGIGPGTVAGAAAAGLRGIVMEAGGAILLDREAALASATAAGIFLLSIRPDEFDPEQEIRP